MICKLFFRLLFIKTYVLIVINETIDDLLARLAVFSDVKATIVLAAYVVAVVAVAVPNVFATRQTLIVRV